MTDLLLTINGIPRTDVPAGTSVDGLLDLLDLPQRDRGVAVAIGSEVVPRSEWTARELADGDAVEVLVAVQGG